MKILVATEDLTFSVSLSQAYRALGHEVSAGLPELYLGLRDFDMIHFHWPEELTGWALPPAPSAVRRLLERIDALKPATKMVCTVHNLRPHADRGRDAEALYAAFYARMDVIGHFSDASLAAVMTHYPAVQHHRHVVHGMQDFCDLLPLATPPAAARVKLGIDLDTLAVAIIGQLRSHGELALLAGALTRSKRPAMQLIRAFRPPPATRIVERIRRRRRMTALARIPGVTLNGFIDNSALVAVCQAADIIVVPRMADQLNSGVLPLAMTFGTGIVAPDCGVFRETLAGSMNELYAPGDPAAMAQAIERLARKDAVAVRQANRAWSADWGWSRGVSRILAAVAT